jgi:hypothetical protein
MVQVMMQWRDEYTADPAGNPPLGQTRVAPEVESGGQSGGSIETVRTVAKIAEQRVD